ncbi:hypothetical protein [Paenibacillus odorifer]|uniref:hypothetical protein n=1 Tax=Paenibacillus odorifer TaxID=189426 RepID=UPI001E2E644E|nr:hypothetical protein [Paenibacillus odorifer]
MKLEERFNCILCSRIQEKDCFLPISRVLTAQSAIKSNVTHLIRISIAQSAIKSDVAILATQIRSS